jgi:hypothetical protein
LKNRKIKNVLNLEMNELTADIIKGIVLLKIFNSFLPRAFSYFNPAFLDSPNKSVKVLYGSS